MVVPLHSFIPGHGQEEKGPSLHLQLEGEKGSNSACQ